MKNLMVCEELDGDPLARLPYMGFDKLFDTSTLLARSGDDATNDRIALKNFLNYDETYKNILSNELAMWRKEAETNGVNLKTSLNSRIMVVLGKALLGVEIFPPDDNSELSLAIWFIPCPSPL